MATEKTMKWYATGHDFGNNEVGTVTILSKNEQWMHTMPTAFCRVDVDVIKNLNNQEVQLQQQKEPAKKGRGKAAKVPAKAVSQKPKDAEVPEASVIQFMNESLAYAVGNYALSQGKRVWTGRGDDLRYATKHSVRGLIANVATRIPDKEFGLYVVTGLPGDLIMKHGMSLRQAIKKELDGTYDFSIDGGEQRRCVIEVATVVMEGAGALVAYTDRFPVSKTALCGVIDIGGGTTDLYAQRNGAPVTEYCQSDRNGVETAAQILRQIFEKKYPDRALSDEEVREIMFAFSNDNPSEFPFPTITYYGQAVPATELAAMAEEATDIAGDEITSFIASAWRQAHGGAGFSPLVLIGGGYHYFFKKIKERIPHVVDLLDITGNDDDGNKEDMLDPVYANARGYAILASRFLKKKMEAEAAAAAAAKEQGQVVEGSVNQNIQESEECIPDEEQQADQKEVAATTVPESHDRYWNA